MNARDDYPGLLALSEMFSDRAGGQQAQQALAEIDRLREERGALLARRDEVMRESGRIVETLVRQIDRVRELCDGSYGYAYTVTLIKDVIDGTGSSGLGQDEPGGAVEAERRQDQPEPCNTAAPTSSYMIRRAWGGGAGPFESESAALPYMNAGDEIVVYNEHGNVIDYGPQFDEGDGDTPKCPGCLLKAYKDDPETTTRRGRRWHWSCVP